ncbi:hypothetical protein B4079_3149 [Bacillus cereus]|nr:hypothetical protein B4079_3149 [Bacillus cereus]
MFYQFNVLNHTCYFYRIGNLTSKRVDESGFCIIPTNPHHNKLTE